MRIGASSSSSSSSLVGLCIFGMMMSCVESFVMNTKIQYQFVTTTSMTRLQANNNNNNDGSSDVSGVDRAPCLDGVCSSEPEEVVMGESMKRLGGIEVGPTVWSEFGRLGNEYTVEANLGQGFPDWTPPKFAIDSLVEASLDVDKSPHQYTRTAGHPPLVQRLAQRYSIHLHQSIDPMNEIAVTVGASQALYLSLQTLLQPGDEVILFEPFFDLYVNQIKLAGGVPVYVPLTFVPYENDDDSSGGGGEWKLEDSVVKEKITQKTRAIILNSPHNPTGKVFTKQEMESIAKYVQTQAGPQCVVLSDEVYKYIIHSPPPMDENESELDNSSKNLSCPGHVHFATLPGMWERTITISSAGKTFSATGWQVGWCIGPRSLIQPIHQLLPYVQFCASTVIQDALARTLIKADEPYEGFPTYYDYLRAMYTRKRDLLASSLKQHGFGIPNYNDQTPGGGFFIFARMTPKIQTALPSNRINVPNPAAPGGIARKDWAFCQWLLETKGILCIPASPFFSSQPRTVTSNNNKEVASSDEFIRIAFCKSDDTIQTAAHGFSLLQPTTNEEEEEETEMDKKTPTTMEQK